MMIDSWFEEVKGEEFGEALMWEPVPQSGSFGGKSCLIGTFFLKLEQGGNEGDLALQK